MTAPLAVADRTFGNVLQKGMIGKNYHIGLGTTDPVSGKSNMYGFTLVPESLGGTGFEERTDLTTRDKLIQIASPNVIDRDLVTIPRITDGDDSGGGLQQVWINPKQYYDSDLEIRVPGNLQLRPAWARHDFGVLGAQIAPAPRGVAITYLNDVYVTFGETSKFIYNTAGYFAPPYATYSMDTDGRILYGADRSGNVWASGDGNTFTSWATGIDSNIVAIWAVSLGTVGQFLYYSFAGAPTWEPLSLSRIDISVGWPYTAANVDPVPLGGFNPYAIVDLVPFAGGIAILCNEFQADGMAVYYHDGVVMQLLLKIHGYTGVGITDCLGELYVTANSYSLLEPPVLLRISSGSFNVVARWGSLLGAGARGSPSTIGAPTTTGQYVGFVIQYPAISGVTQNSYLALYDALSDSSSHFGNLDAGATTAVGLRGLAWLGRAAFLPQIRGAEATLQYQTNQLKLAPAGTVPVFVPSGRKVSSLIDFGTPAISKQFRRVAVHHAALQPGESITIQAFVNSDPVNYTQTLVPTATATHAYAVGEAAPVRSPSNPVLTGAGWEGTTVVEPTVIYDAGVFKMWYRGGWAAGVCAIGYATSPDGITWTKYASNPVIAASAQQPHVHKVGSTYHIFYVSTNLQHATSTDGITWGSPHADLTLAGTGWTQFGNSSFLIDGTGTWHMLVEAMPGGYGTQWKIYLFSSPDGTTWTIQNGGNPLTSLEVFPGGGYSGPSIYPSQVDGKYQLWYHAVDAAAMLPSDIYHATSLDLVNWTVQAPSPLLTHLGTGFEFDQVADPCVVEASGTSYLFYDGDNNATSSAAIGVATVGETVAAWLNTTADPTPNNTVVQIPYHVLGTSMYFVVILGAGTNQQTSPTVYWTSVEVSPGWAVEFTVACSSKLLDMGSGRDDPQQLMGSDRYGLLHNAWENGQTLTYWAPNGNTLLMAIQDCRFKNPDPKNFATPLSVKDSEYFAHLVLVETDTP